MFVFKDFKQKFVRFSDVETDNIVFRLHYRLTFWFLSACCILVSSRQFINEHINCIGDKRVQHVINSFCFFSTTYTVVPFDNSTRHSAYLGVAPYDPKDKIVRHSYYQWVPFALFLQALLFYVPRKIWKKADNGRLSAVVRRMKTTQLDNQNGRDDKIDWLSRTYLTMNRFKINRDWAKTLVLCEFLNGLNVICQLVAMNAFLNGGFWSLGPNWWRNEFDRIDFVFPKMTKCTFHTFGPSATIQLHDTLCVMSLNIVNEKIYVLLWFWLVPLLLVTWFALLWRLIAFICHRRSAQFNKIVWSEISPGPTIQNQDVRIVTEKLNFSDWLFLYYIGKNVDGKMFRVAVSQIARELSQNKPNRLIKLDDTNDNEMNESEC